MKETFVDALFYEEPAGAFSHGLLLKSKPDLTGAKDDPDIGYWHCDIAHQDRLTWSDKVYELFGLSPGSPVLREWAVTRYGKTSKTSLERVRKYALSRNYGFILDAAIRQEGGDSRWIRVLAVPILADGRIVGLHGLKRPL